jgi:hypothetical protein
LDEENAIGGCIATVFSGALEVAGDVEVWSGKPKRVTRYSDTYRKVDEVWKFSQMDVAKLIVVSESSSSVNQN